jgi:hypothetical protein
VPRKDESEIKRGELRRERDEGSKIERAELRRQFRNFVIFVGVILGLTFLAIWAIRYWRGTPAG